MLAFRDAGLEGLEIGAFFALLAPVGTPHPIVRHVYAAVNAPMHTPEIRRSAAERGAEVIVATPAKFSSNVRTDADRRKLAQEMPALRED